MGMEREGMGAPDVGFDVVDADAVVLGGEATGYSFSSDCGLE